MKVLTCLEFDAQGVCTQEVWADQMPLGLPPLTPEEGAQLGAAVLGLFAVAWIFKRLRRFLENL